jgi:hypothetical protein
MKYNFKASDPLLVWQGEQVFLADSAAGYAGTSASRSVRSCPKCLTMEVESSLLRTSFSKILDLLLFMLHRKRC